MFIKGCGEPLKELGKAIFEIQLGQETITEEIIVAEIEDEALLGLDILTKTENGPVDIKLHDDLITFRGHEIKVSTIPDRIRKVSTVDVTVIPPYSEALVDVFIDRSETDQTLPKQIFCIEPSSDFNNRFSLLMASCLVDLENKVTTKIRVMNPLKTEISIKQGEYLGDADTPRDGPSTVGHPEVAKSRAEPSPLKSVEEASTEAGKPTERQVEERGDPKEGTARSRSTTRRPGTEDRWSSPTRLSYEMMNGIFALHRSMDLVLRELQTQTDLLKAIRDQGEDNNRRFRQRSPMRPRFRSDRRPAGNGHNPRRF